MTPDNVARIRPSLRPSGGPPRPSGRPPQRTLLPTSRGKIIGRNTSIAHLLQVAKRVAPSMCTVLVSGESGTGKELIVAALHDQSPRAEKPLIAVNCGAIPEALIESELFGHAKGAFTGAHAARQGHVAAAEGGTLFLDEIGELSLSTQVKILRLLQQREYTPVGESKTIKCSIRVVAATNRDLEAEVAAGRFREDLFFRLNVVNLHVPPLRERKEDVEVLAAHFLLTSAMRAGRTDVTGFAPEAMEALLAYDWPGNVRALENAVERAVLLTSGPLIGLEDLPPKLRGEPPSQVMIRAASPHTGLPTTGIDLRAAVEHYENELIRQALERTGGNRNRAAQLLKINRTTLVEMLKRKGL